MGEWAEDDGVPFGGRMNLASVLNRNEKAPGGSDVWQRKGLFSSFFEVWQAQDLAAFFWMCGKERS